MVLPSRDWKSCGLMRLIPTSKRPWKVSCKNRKGWCREVRVHVLCAFVCVCVSVSCIRIMSLGEAHRIQLLDDKRCMDECLHACVLACLHTHTCIHTYIHTCIHTYMHAYIHMYANMHTYMHGRMPACICTCMLTHTYTHMHTYVHTFIGYSCLMTKCV
jgi:hypothetical protein